ncbi:TIM barrel protein [Chitinophaga pendula]|nr:hydroxypyruvate isomerase [Chitinophaga sp. MD30]UCJ06729.1 TIM barrel protein [Chitinophaga pendula]
MLPENSRRDMIKKAAAMAFTATSLSALTNRILAHEITVDESLKGNIRHSVCAWCYDDISLDALCKAAVQIGLQSIDLVDPVNFHIVKQHGLTCAMVAAINKDWGITKGWNRLEHHDALVTYYEGLIDATAAAGFPHLICFSGNREGLSDQQGLQNCATGLTRIMAYAEKKNVTIVMELLNSKVDHPDYQCDHTAWGVQLCKAIGSNRFKLLYDIYHMQIMEGDVIRTIRDNHQYIAHYHTGGVPGRHEIDESQELYYPAIMKAIHETGFKGFVAQEFVPARPDKLQSLKQAVQICDI